MRPFRMLLLTPLALAGVAVFTTLMPQVSADEHKVIVREHEGEHEGKYRYVYYPQAEVYYVPETGIYWYYDQSTWRHDARPPSDIRLGTGYEIEEDQPYPWERHETIVKKYGGKHHEKVKIIEKEKD